MPRQPFSIFCIIIGFLIATLGALVLFAQCIEWWSFGNWNPVSVRYAFDYFEIQPPYFISTALGMHKIFRWARDGILDLPLNITLLGVGGFIAVIGGMHAQQTAKKAGTKKQIEAPPRRD